MDDHVPIIFRTLDEIAEAREIQKARDIAELTAAAEHVEALLNKET